MKVVFSPKAENDLESIGDTIASDNPRRAVTFIHEIRSHCHTLSSTPEAAPKRDDIAQGIRMLAHGNYLMFYRIIETEIRIERVLHGARDLSALIGEPQN